MSSQNLSTIDRDICQPTSRLIDDAFSDGYVATGSATYIVPQTGTAAAITGHSTVVTATEITATTYLKGVLGSVAVTGTLNGSNVHVTGLHGQVYGAGTYTEVSHISAIWADSQLSAAPTAGEYELFRGANNGSGIVGQMIYLWGGADYFLKAAGRRTTGGDMWYNPTEDKATTSRGWLKVNVDGDDRYIALYVGA